MRKLFIIFCCSAVHHLMISKSFSQDLTFSQFYEQPLLRNPALAGVFNGDIRVSMAYRNQWQSVTVPYRTTALSVEYKLPSSKNNDVFTIGTQMNLDGAGDIRLNRTQFLPAVSFHKSLSNNNDTYISAAFMGGPVYSQFDQTLAIFGDQYQNGNYTQGNLSSQPLKASGYSYWDLYTGIAFSSTINETGRFYVGGALAHFNHPVIKTVTGATQYNLPLKYTFNVGINYPLNDRARLVGFGDYLSQNGSREIFMGLLYGVDIENYYDSDPYAIYFGSFLRWKDALIPVVKIDFHHFSIGVSYDINISKLVVVSNYRGGFELTASYKGFLKVTNTTLDKVRCVRF
jgi:type IX secretion system PorP/SprF family membrane protein